jgi:hypothetical protein
MTRLFTIDRVWVFASGAYTARSHPHNVDDYDTPRLQLMSHKGNAG